MCIYTMLLSISAHVKWFNMSDSSHISTEVWSWTLGLGHWVSDSEWMEVAGSDAGSDLMKSLMIKGLY